MENELLASIEGSERDLLGLRDTDLKSQKLLFEAGDQINQLFSTRLHYLLSRVAIGWCHR